MRGPTSDNRARAAEEFGLRAWVAGLALRGEPRTCRQGRGNRGGRPGGAGPAARAEHPGVLLSFDGLTCEAGLTVLREVLRLSGLPG